MFYGDASLTKKVPTVKASIISTIDTDLIRKCSPSVGRVALGEGRALRVSRPHAAKRNLIRKCPLRRSSSARRGMNIRASGVR